MSRESLKMRRRRSKASQLARFLRREGKKYCAIALCASLIMGNLAYVAVAADEEPDLRFEMERQELSDALQEAIANGVMANESFEFMGVEADHYDILMSGENLYELKPEIENNDGDLQLRIFVRMGESELINDISTESNADVIESDGSEKIYFLLINTSDDVKTAAIRVGDKETEWITVEPYSAVEMPEPEGQSGGPGVNDAPVDNVLGGSAIAGGSSSSGGGGNGSGSGGGSSLESSVESIKPEQETEESVADSTEIPETEATMESENSTEAGITESDAAEDDGDSDLKIEVDENVSESDSGITEDTDVKIDDSDVADDKENSSDLNDSNAADGGTDSEESDDADDSDSDGVSDDAEDGNAEAGNTEEQNAEAGNAEAGNAGNENAGNSVDDNNSSSKDSGEVAAAISFHKTYRVATSKATDSDATPSDATASDAAKESLDGTVYDSVRLGDDSAVVFETTLSDVGITADGHLIECEDDCSGKECECACHAVAYGLIADIENLLTEVRAYDETTTTDTMFAAYDKLMGTIPDAIDKASENGELTDAEYTYVYEVFNASGMEIMQIFQTLGFDPFATKMAALGEVDSAEATGVTVKMFNYDNSVNTRTDGLGPNGYVFFQGDYADDAKEGSVDGVGSGSNTYNKLTLASTLNANGYPYETKHNKSLEYLFSETVTNSYWKGTTDADGGGLFQKDGDDYYYDSAKNAAWFNTDTDEFTLYDTVVRPKYVSSSKSDIQRGNFLPFNEVANLNSDTTLTTGAKGAALTDPVDLWFGMIVEFEFLMPKDGYVNGSEMKFDFHGDDDVFVYIDNKLVLDIGGTHGAQSGTINFATGAVSDPTGSKTLKNIFGLNDTTFADYSKHKLKFFYMERGGNISYCRLKFNIPVLPERSLTVAKELVTNEGSETVADYIKNSVEYKFRVVTVDSAGNATDIPYVTEGTKFKILENGADTKTEGTVGADGYFVLKAGQSAQFDKMIKENVSDISYIVEEIIPDKVSGQYAGVEYAISEAVGTIKPVNGTDEDGEEFTAHQTKVLSAEETQIVTYRNKVDTKQLSVLNVTKEKAPGTIFDENQTFDIQVKLGGELLPAGTEYQVGFETKTVDNVQGIIVLGIGETATILNGIVAGTKYEISEIIGTNDGFEAAYSGVIKPIDGAADDIVGTVVTSDPDKVTGEFTPGDEVTVTVTNSYAEPATIILNKTTTGFAESEENTFRFKVEPYRVEDAAEDTRVFEDTSIMITGNKTEVSGNMIIGYESTESGIFYYKITEKPDDAESMIIYDDTEYVVKIEVVNGNATVKDVYTIASDGKLVENTDNVLSFTNVDSTNITINKTVKGNLGDRNKDFTFTVTLADGSVDLKNAVNAFEGSNRKTFTLRHGEAETLTKLPIGAVITITEENGDYTASYVITPGEENATVIEGDGAAAETTITRNEMTIAFINEKGDTVDTGVLLDSMPYILILAAAVAGIAVYMIHKRKKEEDELD